jgi:hypothetical protein
VTLLAEGLSETVGGRGEELLDFWGEAEAKGTRTYHHSRPHGDSAAHLEHLLSPCLPLTSLYPRRSVGTRGGVCKYRSSFWEAFTIAGLFMRGWMAGQFFQWRQANRQVDEFELVQGFESFLVGAFRSCCNLRAWNGAPQSNQVLGATRKTIHTLHSIYALSTTRTGAYAPGSCAFLETGYHGSCT